MEHIEAKALALRTLAAMRERLALVAGDVPSPPVVREMLEFVRLLNRRSLALNEGERDND